MWIYTHKTLRLRSRLSEEVAGTHRAVLELAAAMQAELDDEHVDPSVLWERQLKDRIEKGIGSGSVSYAYPHSVPKSYSMWKGFKAWFKVDKWWLLVMCATSAICSTFWLYAFRGNYMSSVYLWSWLWSVWLGQLWAFLLGTTTGSRALIILAWSVVGAIVVGSCMSLTSGYNCY